MPNPNLTDALSEIESFMDGGLSARIAEIEWSVSEADGPTCSQISQKAGATSDLLTGAYAIKRAAGQINVLIHAVAGMLLLPKIMEPGERVEYVSLGAGNTGRSFDLETNRRVAEFKFIHWKGGAEAIRQNSLFKDFYLLAEHDTPKRKELYVIGTEKPLRFLRSGRSISSVLSRNRKLGDEFTEKYGNRYKKVCDYYRNQLNTVMLIDVCPLLPELTAISETNGDMNEIPVE